MPPPPPPPPGPPPPGPPPSMANKITNNGTPPGGGGDRNALLAQIRGSGTGKVQLRKVETVDKSGPAGAGKVCGEENKKVQNGSSYNQKPGGFPKSDASASDCNGGGVSVNKSGGGGLIIMGAAVPKLRPVGRSLGPAVGVPDSLGGATAAGNNSKNASNCSSIIASGAKPSIAQKASLLHNNSVLRAPSVDSAAGHSNSNGPVMNGTAEPSLVSNNSSSGLNGGGGGSISARGPKPPPPLASKPPGLERRRSSVDTSAAAASGAGPPPPDPSRKPSVAGLVKAASVTDQDVAGVLQKKAPPLPSKGPVGPQMGFGTQTLPHNRQHLRPGLGNVQNSSNNNRLTPRASSDENLAGPTPPAGRGGLESGKPLNKSSTQVSLGQAAAYPHSLVSGAKMGGERRAAKPTGPPPPPPNVSKPQMPPPPPPNSQQPVPPKRPLPPPPTSSQPPPPPPVPKHNAGAGVVHSQAQFSASAAVEPAPLPPARHTSRRNTGPQPAACESEFERRFRFRDANELPPPMKFRNVPKKFVRSTNSRKSAPQPPQLHKQQGIGY